jgi:hypothetical protein
LALVLSSDGITPAIPIPNGKGGTKLVYLGRKPNDPLAEEADRLRFKDAPFTLVYYLAATGAHVAGERAAQFV